MPFLVTDALSVALRQKIILAYPSISEKVLDAQTLQALAGHIRAGGTVIAPNVVGGGMGVLFGIAQVQPSRVQQNISLTPDHPLTLEFEGSDERVLPIATSRAPDTEIGTNGYRVDGGSVVTTFDDGSAAIVERRLAAAQSRLDSTSISCCSAPMAADWKVWRVSMRTVTRQRLTYC